MDSHSSFFGALDADGNGAAIFTQSGATARKFERNVEAGQIGINTPIPVPLPFFSWSGNKGSVLGGASLYGPRGLDFWTQLKVRFSRSPPPLVYEPLTDSCKSFFVW